MNHALQLVPLLSETEISVAVHRLAQEIDQHYSGQSPILICMLKGSFMFFADLIRAIQTPLPTIEFMQVSSYGSGTVSSGEARMVLGIAPDLVTNQHVILVEDIVDTGTTTSTVMQLLNEYHPASLKLCSLLDKPSRRKTPVVIDYLGFTVPDRFIVGYGIDFNQQYRQLPAIYCVEPIAEAASM